MWQLRRWNCGGQIRRWQGGVTCVIMTTLNGALPFQGIELLSNSNLHQKLVSGEEHSSSYRNSPALTLSLLLPFSPSSSEKRHSDRFFYSSSRCCCCRCLHSIDVINDDALKMMSLSRFYFFCDEVHKKISNNRNENSLTLANNKKANRQERQSKKSEKAA